MRAKEMAHGELALFLYRWCYPFLSLSSTKKDREKEKTWSLLLAHLPAVYRTLIPTKRRIDRDLYSGLYILSLYKFKSNRLFLSANILSGTGDCVFSFPFHIDTLERISLMTDRRSFTANVKQTVIESPSDSLFFYVFLFFFPRTYKMLIYIQILWYTLPSVPDRVRVMCVLNWLFLLILANFFVCVLICLCIRVVIASRIKTGSIYVV